MDSRSTSFLREASTTRKATASDSKNIGMLGLARQTLLNHIRYPNDSIPFRWNAATITGREIIDINCTYPIARAWSLIEPKTAESLIKSVFFLQSRDGSLSARYLPDTTPLTKEAPWPLLIQATKIVWESNRNREFLEAVLPRLYRYADWLCYHFSPTPNQIPKWHSNEEALIPEDFNPEFTTPDLPILILCELEALSSLEIESSTVPEDGINLTPHKERLARVIQENFWDRDQETISTINGNGSFVPDSPLFYTALACMSRSITPEIRIQIKPVVLKALQDVFAPELWPRTSGFRINSIYPLLMSAAAHNMTILEEQETFRNRIWTAIGNHCKYFGSLPPDLSALDHDKRTPEFSNSYSNSLLTSALVIDVWYNFRETGTPQLPIQKKLRLLNKHPALSIGIPLTAIGLTVVLLTLFSMFRKSPTGSAWETGLGLARRYYELGEYEDALTICDKYSGVYNYVSTPDLLKAKIFYKMGEYEQAAEIYRSLLEKGAYPLVRINLALVKYRQGEKEEAIELYQDFIEKCGRDFPREARRAANAINLIQKHSVSATGTQT